MKKISVISAFLFAVLYLHAQTSGVINYTEMIKLHIDMPGQDPEMMKKIPQTHSIQRALIYNGSESIYKNQVGNQDLDINNQAENGGEVRMVMKSPESTMYTDTKTNAMINSQEFFGKTFLVTGEIKKRQWKITGEQKSILDYPCIKAALQDTTNTVAWFTTKLPVNLGPNGLSGLPGTILMVDVDNGERITTATKITPREVTAAELTKPDKGKKITVEEFDKIKADKMKEMGGTVGKGGTMRVIVNQERH